MKQEKICRLGEILKELRRNNMFTQKFVAEQLGVTRSAYTYYELGKTSPSIKSLLILCKLYNVSIEYFISEESPNSYLYDINSDEDLKLNKDNISPTTMSTLTGKERELIGLYRLLSENDKTKIRTDMDKSMPDED